MDIPIITERVKNLKAVVAVLSGKGGVGKSTVSVNVARELASRGISTLLLDFDLSGPSIPRLTGTLDECIVSSPDGSFLPIELSSNLHTVSVGHIEGTEEEVGSFNTRSKHYAIKSILKGVDLTGIDVMLIDTPPNITEEHFALASFLKPLCAITVATSQQFAIDDVRRQLSFCQRVGIPVRGVVENMRRFRCTACGHVNEVFPGHGVEGFCRAMDLRYFGHIEISQEIARRSDEGLGVKDETFIRISDSIEEYAASMPNRDV